MSGIWILNPQPGSIKCPIHEHCPRGVKISGLVQKVGIFRLCALRSEKLMARTHAPSNLKSSGSEQSIATQQAKANCSTGYVPEENAKGMVRKSFAYRHF